MFKNILNQRKREYLRKSLRGYQKLKNSGNLQLISNVQKALLLCSLIDKNEKGCAHIFGRMTDRADLITRQYLYIRLLSVHLPRAIFLSIESKSGKVAFPLPPSWQAVLTTHEIPVSKWKCNLLWILFILLMWGYGVLTIIKLSIQNFREVIKPEYSKLGNMVHFEHLSHHNFPKKIKSGQSYDFVSWYFTWHRRIRDLNTITHRAANVETQFVGPQFHAELTTTSFKFLEFPILPLGTVLELVKFIGWSIYSTIVSFLSILMGRWQCALLLSEAALAKNANLLPETKIAGQYFLNNSNSAYRPLWTYEMEARGAEIIHYFYSTNCEGFDFSDGTGRYNIGSLTMNWPEYLVWDQEQVDFIKQSIGPDFSFEIVGPIWFSESSKQLTPFKEKNISVFDVQPMRTSIYYAIGLDVEYYIPEFTIKFMDDVFRAAEQTNHTIYWKKKRNIGKKLHPVFMHGTKHIEASDLVNSVEPEISANRVIEQSDMVISMPFTSTALIAKHRGKPSCYYDASGLLQPDDKGAHGIPIIQDRKTLIEWIQLNSK